MDVWKSVFQLDRLDRLKRFVGLEPVEKAPDAVRIGVLGAAKVCRCKARRCCCEACLMCLTQLPIAPQVATYALIWPARRRPDVVVEAVAARDPERAAQYAKQHG